MEPIVLSGLWAGLPHYSWPVFADILRGQAGSKIFRQYMGTLWHNVGVYIFIILSVHVLLPNKIKTSFRKLASAKQLVNVGVMDFFEDGQTDG